MRVRETCTSPFVHAEARQCSTSNSVAQKEGQNFSNLAHLEVSELRTRQKKLTQSGKTTSKMSEEWGK
jgi:hypothetical protein